jgi:hypothetical protein
MIFLGSPPEPNLENLKFLPNIDITPEIHRNETGYYRAVDTRFPLGV